MAKKPASHGLSTTRTSGLLPEGTYRFKVVEAEEREGDAGLYWNFTVECQTKPFVGNRTWVVISHSSQSRFKADEWLDAFGIPEDDEAFMEDFVGLTFRGTVEHKPNKQGSMKADISSFLPDAKGSGTGKGVSAPSSKGKAKPKVQMEEDEEENEEEDVEEDDEEDEDEEDIDEEEEEADDEEDVEEEDEDEEESDEEDAEPVKPHRKPKPAPSKGKGKLPADVKSKPKFRKPF